MSRSQTEIRVRYEETDQMGVVYHAKYFSWFEVSRIQLLDEIGQPYKQLEEKGYFLPVLSCSASFIKPAHFDDRLLIDTNAFFVSSIKLAIEYEVYRDDELIAKGKTLHAFVSQQGRPIRPPSSIVGFL